MHESRRTFLGAVCSLLAAAKLGAAQLQPSGGIQDPFPFPSTRRLPDAHEPSRDLKAELKAKQELIKKAVSRLTDLVADLRKELDDNDTKEVLSMDVIRKAEGIEKLAKQIRELVRG